MCGLTGIFTTRAETGDALENSVRRMMEPIAHRGPDDSGVWIGANGRLAFGFRRLSILDLSQSGHQPMTSASGRFAIVFNGEIYNHLELRHELERRAHRFVGRSDTETILAGFEEWGVRETVRHLVGMFAIAVWDDRRRELSLARDRLGIKPLYVYRQGTHVLFGSELKAVIAGPHFDATLDETAVDAYLRFLYVPAPLCIFRHVRKLLPAHILRIGSLNAPPSPAEPYWSVEEVALGGSAHRFDAPDEESVDRLESLLTESVRLRLQSDVPLGALLSGGIDSSTVVALAQRLSADPLKTYTIGFDVESHNEAPAARAIAQHLGTDHTELMVTGEDAMNVVPSLPELFDEPLADPSQIPTYLVCQLARRDVTVALSGDGGDEVFTGYNRYIHGAALIERLRRLPEPARRAVGGGIRALPVAFWDRAYRAFALALPGGAGDHLLAGEKLMKLGTLAKHPSVSDMYMSLLSPWQGDHIPPEMAGSAPSRSRDLFERTEELPLVDRMMLADQATYLPDDLLAKVDRASMAVGLEVRVPLLDHRVVEFGWSLPSHLRVRDGKGKWILRRLLERYVPRKLFDRPKIGFTVPIASWIYGPLRDTVKGASADGAGILDPAGLERAWQAFESGQTGLANGLWAVYMLAAWRERWSV